MIVVIVTLLTAIIAAAASAGRWLRVAQREHYIAPWVSILAMLWLKVRPINAVLAVVALALSVVGAVGWMQQSALAWATPAALLLIAALPIGLGIRGTSAKLAWTDRLKRLTAIWAVVMIVAGALLWLLVGIAGLPVVLLLAPPLMDLALKLAVPLERRLSRKFVVSARKRLAQVRPIIVAITGSYGKTSTKNYVAHLLAGSTAIVASPASFNNEMGLARAVNERVVPGTEVFVAEMGVYGVGDIRALAKNFPPDIAAITTIGEAHLARMGSREVVFQAKSEITEEARTVVLPIDEDMLAGLAETCRQQGKRVITVSTTPSIPADVVVDEAGQRITVTQFGETVTSELVVPRTGHAVNLAVSLGIAVGLDIDVTPVLTRLGDLPQAHHRAEVQYAPSGAVVIDDTYNSNPVGAERALRGAAQLAEERGGPLVVVTPGMVELGTAQAERNQAFAASIAKANGYLFAIARTNRAALVRGGSGGAHPVATFDQRNGAVAAAVDQAGDRGVILYENDLPDHYP